MNIKRNIIVLGAAFFIMGSATAAFAGPSIGPENAQEYAVSAQDTPFLFGQPQTQPAQLRQNHNADQGALIAPADPHWGPAFDPDVE
ncbi:hypothetical protein [Azorhizobium sp. AG788]|uniref:hypothetical protein n=1 Tax=Azorhizobium sp. AG788 TaxID=2183897 RepID=UPI003139EDEF